MADGGVDPSHATWVTAIGGAFATLLVGLLTFVGSRMLGKAAFQTALNDGFAKITQELRHELRESKRDRSYLRQTLEEERVLTKVERTTLQNEINQLTQVVESMKALLRRHGIDVPHTRPPFTVEDPPPAMLTLPPLEPLENWDLDNE